MALMIITAVALIVELRWPHQRTCDLTGWSLGLLLAAQGSLGGQRVRARNAGPVAAFVLMALVAAAAGQLAISWLASIAACFALVMPAAPPLPATRAERQSVWALVNRTSGDTLAPFALRTDKSYVFAPNGRAAVAYRVRFGTAVASGDPVGNADSREAAIDAFCAYAAEHGWRVSALGVGEGVVDLWRARGLRALSIGREVALDVAGFTMQGRPFRNLRQTVRHTHACRVRTEIMPEAGLDPQLRQELEGVLKQTPAGLQPRGFSMILDRPLTDEHPGTFIAVARDRSGRAVACQRYASTDEGRELTLDLPWRLRDAPNGVNERLIVDTIAWARDRGGVRVSLCFAAFPDLFAASRRGAVLHLAYWAVHMLDGFIELESLYRFQRKFHAFSVHRYVALRLRDLLPVAAAMLALEFASVAKPSNQDRP